MAWLLWSAVAFSAEAPPNFIPYTTTITDRLISFVGIFLIAGIAWLGSENRKAIQWRPVIWGIALQLVFGFIVLSPAVSTFFYTVVDGGVRKLLSFSEAGTSFLFGTISPHSIVVGDPSALFAGGGVLTPMIGEVSPPLKTFAFWILPTIVFFSALMSLFYHLGIMQQIVKVMGWAMVRTMGTSGAESLSTAGNIFLGQTESPLLVKPFIATMTRSELMCIMVGGFATVAGGVMGAYVKFLDGIPNIAGHLVIASIIAAPATIAISKLIVPETEVPKTAGNLSIDFERTSSNAIEAAGRGANEGMGLAINVAAMLIAFVGLMAMIDYFISWVPVTFCADGATAGYHCVAGAVGEPLSASRLFGWLFAPLALLMGIPPAECIAVGRLLGEKIVLTEFIAYINLGKLIHGATPVLSERSSVIASYALCGFANFASVGIQLGGIGGMAPDRLPDLASLGVKAMLAGMLATCMCGAVAGVIL